MANAPTTTNNIRALISGDAMRKQFALALPKVLPVDRFLRVLMTTLNNNPKLLDCDQNSVLASCMTAAQLGLEIDPVLGRAYLVPFKGKCQLVVGYKGYVDLAYRSGQLIGLSAEAVYEKDTFSYAMGLNERLEHIPSEDEDRGALKFAYAVATLTGGGKVWKVLNRGDVMRAKKSSQSAGSDTSPWKLHEASMWVKTAVRALSKFLPLSPELRDAIAHDEGEDRDQAAAYKDVTGSATVQQDPPPEQKPTGLTPQVRLQTAVVQASQSGVDASKLDALLGKAISAMNDAEAEATLTEVEKLVAAKVKS